MNTKNVVGFLLTFVFLPTACIQKFVSENAKTRGFGTAQGMWHPQSVLRDTTQTFVGSGDENNRPENGGWWVTPVHAVLLPKSGQVLMTGWGRKERNTCHVHGSNKDNGQLETRIGSRRNGTSWLLNPTDVGAKDTLNIVPLNEQPREASDVLYCAGHTFLPNGDVLYVGGATYSDLGKLQQEVEYGLDYARIFSSEQKNFDRVRQHTFRDGPVFPPKSANNYPAPPARFQQNNRVSTLWYPTATRLPDGKVMIASGFVNCCNKKDSRLDFHPNNTIHLFDASASNAPIRTLVANDNSSNEFAPGMKDYTHSLLLYKPVKLDGQEYQVALIGFNGAVTLFNFETKQFRIPPNGRRPSAERRGETEATWNSTAALLPSGEIMIFGGSPNKTSAQRADIYDPYEFSWRHIDTGIGRENPAVVLMPDGKVLVTNGWADGQPVEGNRKSPVIIDPNPLLPQEQQVVRLDGWPDREPERGYHSFALLLKDGRILIGGGTHERSGPNGTADVGCEQPTIRLLTPPYLMGDAKRPSLADNGSELSFKIKGAPLLVKVNGKIREHRGVVLMAPGATTHSFDQNQRYVSLDFRQQGDTLTITPPAEAMHAPVGKYLLFLIGADGVPSEGRLADVHF